MASQFSNDGVTLVAIAKTDSEGAIVYHFEINGSNQSFEARTIDRDGIRAVEMSEPLERLLQQLFPVAPHIAKTLVEVTLTVMDGSDGVLPMRMV